MSEALRTGPNGRAFDAPAGVRSYVEEILAISEQLRSNGALGLILVDASTLGVIEHSYGIDAFNRTRDQLHRMIVESCADDLRDDDLVVAGELGSEQMAVFFFRPRGHDVFYRESLATIADGIREAFRNSGNQIVYPYRRETPILPVGQALIFYNPGMRAERQVREALHAATRDAELNDRIEARDRSKLITDLVLSEDVTMLYEPIVNVTTREVMGFEALVRGPWDSEMHTPAALFKLAEESNLVFELDCLCRRAALRGAKGLAPGKLLFLNCLPTAIHDPAFRGDVLRQTLEKLRLRPCDMVFEISERESIDNFSIFREARDHYGELGFRIALDDTGVAYGSLEAIMELRPDFIKVDLSLVRGIDTDPPRQELLRALHTVALKLNAQVIAEGIETSEELETIQSLGIPLGQGYLFGRPAPLRRSG
ncbi:MAG: EAL domain-containing protein [Deltaproteobacteria bacterium]|nr:EAL domain-containing protein [Deltaproteobacteria bacterium]